MVKSLYMAFFVGNNTFLLAIAKTKGKVNFRLYKSHRKRRVYPVREIYVFSNQNRVLHFSVGLYICNRAVNYHGRKSNNPRYQGNLHKQNSPINALVGNGSSYLAHIVNTAKVTNVANTALGNIKVRHTRRTAVNNRRSRV